MIYYFIIMQSVSLDNSFNNSKLFFSRIELSKILSCYSSGVSRGKWKDYAINFKKNEAIFFMFKHSLASPDCILTKFKKKKKNEIIFNLNYNNKKKNNFKKIDDLLILLKRNNLKIL